MLGLGDAGDDDPLEVGQDLGEGLGLVRGLRGQRGPDLAGAHLRGHGELRHPLAVVGDPVDEGVAGGAELLGRHGRHCARPSCR